MSGTNGVGTPHNIERKHILGGGTTHILCWGGETAQHLQKKLSSGWVGGWGWSKPENNATLWLHLASWNLPDSQLSWESKMEPSVATCKSDNRKYFPQLPDIALVLGTNIYISILKWIRNEYSRFYIRWTVKPTLWHSLIPLFFWDTLFIYKNRLRQSNLS